MNRTESMLQLAASAAADIGLEVLQATETRLSWAKST